MYDGSEPDEVVLAYLKGQPAGTAREEDLPQQAVARMRWKAPYPILRHHFGRPTMEETLAGVARIAEARVLDLISIGPDQDAQENFFHSERQDPRRRGAGGVPVRSAEDYRDLFRASRCGNYPLMRTYAGTDDFPRLAEMYLETINNAWCAIPIFWFSQMDGRGPWDLEGSIREHQKLMAWHGKRGVPVELNEPHHWALRDAPDVIFVVSAYLSAYNARAFCVQDYVPQMMFNPPPAISDAMDLAKMLASLEIVAPLCDANFRVWRQTRTGLLSYPVNATEAKAHLAASVYVQMALHPHVVHVVSHSEAHHAATAEDVIEACELARRAISDALRGAPDMTVDPVVVERKEELLAEADYTLTTIAGLATVGVPDPLVDPATPTRAVTSGILDAPHLRNSAYARGEIAASADARGAWVAVDAQSGRALSEAERIGRLPLNVG